LIDPVHANQSVIAHCFDLIFFKKFVAFKYKTNSNQILVEQGDMSNEPLPFWTRTGNHVTWARSTCSSDAKGGRCGLSAAEIRSHLESYKNGRTSKGFLLIGESTASACTAWHWHQQLVHLCPPARKESASKTVRPVTIPEEKEDAQVIFFLKNSFAFKVKV
jgi:hypothetical protein